MIMEYIIGSLVLIIKIEYSKSIIKREVFSNMCEYLQKEDLQLII
jgi:hypothetical protein